MKNREEQRLQIACVRWFSYQYPHYAMMLHHSPNGGYRTAAEGRIFKAMGTRAGFPDLILCVKNRHYGCLMIEMKAEGGRQSEAQKEIAKICINVGNLYVVCKDFTTFAKTVKEYLNDVE